MHNNNHETLAPKIEIIHKLHEISKEAMITGIQTSEIELDFTQRGRQRGGQTENRQAHRQEG